MFRFIVLVIGMLVTSINTLSAQPPAGAADSSERILKLTEAMEKLTARIELLDARIAALEREEKPLAATPATRTGQRILTVADSSKIIIDDVAISGGKLVVEFRFNPPKDGFFSLTSGCQAIDDSGDALKCIAVTLQGNRVDFSLQLLQIADVKVRNKTQVKGIIEFELSSEKMQQLRSLTLVGRNGEYGTLADLPVARR